MMLTLSNFEIDHLKRLWRFVGHNMKRRFYTVFAVSLVAAFFEFLSLSLLGPLILTLLGREAAIADGGLDKLVSNFLTPFLPDFTLVLAFVAVVLLAGLLRLLLLWMSIKVSHDLTTHLSSNLFEQILSQDYLKLKKRNSSDLIVAVIQKIALASGILTSVMALMTSLVIALSIVISLLQQEPLFAFLSMMIFVSFYLSVVVLFGKVLRANSLIVAKEQNAALRCLRETFMGIKEVILGGYKQICIIKFESHLSSQQNANATNAFLNQSPRFILETFALVIGSIALLVLTATGNDAEALFAKLAVLGFAAQRLLPLFQQVYGSFAHVAGGRGSIEDALELFEASAISDRLTSGSQSDFQEFRKICLDNASFSYDGKTNVIEKTSISLKRGQCVGFVGETGVGKSTVLDLLLGLLEPTKGRMTVNDVEMDCDKISSWQKLIAHVPQDVFIFDASVFENIAVGIPIDEIDKHRVISVLKKTRLYKQLSFRKGGLMGCLGENGSHLSGGQKQRLGIARALYSGKQVLILDEPTSALDNETERAVMEMLVGELRDGLVIMVSHRKEPLRYCDKVYTIKDKSIIAG